MATDQGRRPHNKAGGTRLAQPGLLGPQGGYFPVATAVVLVAVMLTWQWGRAQLARALYEFGVREGKRIGWLVSLREVLDDIELADAEHLPLAKQMVQGRRRLVETDRAFVFLCSRPVRSLDDFVPVTLRIFLKNTALYPPTSPCSTFTSPQPRKPMATADTR